MKLSTRILHVPVFLLAVLGAACTAPWHRDPVPPDFLKIVSVTREGPGNDLTIRVRVAPPQSLLKNFRGPDLEVDRDGNIVRSRPERKWLVDTIVVNAWLYIDDADPPADVDFDEPVEQRAVIQTSFSSEFTFDFVIPEDRNLVDGFVDQTYAPYDRIFVTATVYPVEGDPFSTDETFFYYEGMFHPIQPEFLRFDLDNLPTNDSGPVIEEGQNPEALYLRMPYDRRLPTDAILSLEKGPGLSANLDVDQVQLRDDGTGQEISDPFHVGGPGAGGVGPVQSDGTSTWGVEITAFSVINGTVVEISKRILVVHPEEE